MLDVCSIGVALTSLNVPNWADKQLNPPHICNSSKSDFFPLFLHFVLKYQCDGNDSYNWITAE